MALHGTFRGSHPLAHVLGGVWFIFPSFGPSIAPKIAIANCNDFLSQTSPLPANWGQKINANFFCTKFFENPSGNGRPRRKSWTSAPKSKFSCGPGGGEKLFDPWASGRKGQECPREIRTKKFMFMLFLIGVTQTVFLLNRVFVPCQKGAVLTKTAKMTNLHSTH